MVLKDSGYTIHDVKGKEVEKFPAATTGQDRHFGNWLAAIRGAEKLNSEIEEGHKTTLLCHLGNIAHRTGKRLICDPERKGVITNDQAAHRMWGREYQPGWEPRV